MNFQVVGCNYRQEDFKRAQIKQGDVLTLQTEPTNFYDPNAIKVLKDGVHIGYVPRHLTKQVAGAMQRPGSLTVESAWPQGCTVILEASVRQQKSDET